MNFGYMKLKERVLITIILVISAVIIGVLNVINWHFRMKLPSIIFSSYQRAGFIAIVLGLIAMLTARLGI